MTEHDGLRCGNTDQYGNVCRCRHLYGQCDCTVCHSKRAQMIEKGDAMLRNWILDRLAEPDEPGQNTLGDYREAES